MAEGYAGYAMVPPTREASPRVEWDGEILFLLDAPFSQQDLASFNQVLKDIFIPQIQQQMEATNALWGRLLQQNPAGAAAAYQQLQQYAAPQVNYQQVIGGGLVGVLPQHGPPPQYYYLREPRQPRWWQRLFGGP